MSKSITKIVKATLGLTMAIGAGVGASVSAFKNAKPIYATGSPVSYGPATFSTALPTDGYWTGVGGGSYCGGYGKNKDNAWSVSLDFDTATGINWSTVDFNQTVSLTTSVKAAGNSASGNVVLSINNEAAQSNTHSITSGFGNGTSSSAAKAVAMNIASVSSAFSSINIAFPAKSFITSFSCELTFTEISGGDPEPTNYTVTYDANGGTPNVVPTDANAYESGSQVTVQGNTGSITKSGKIWSGWNTAANGTGTSYKAGDKFNIAANTTLYARWIDDYSTKDYADITGGYLNLPTESGSGYTAQTLIHADDGIEYVTAPSSSSYKVYAITAANGTHDFDKTSLSKVFLGQNGAYLYNKDPFPRSIDKVEVYASMGCSTKVSVTVDLGTTVRSSSYTTSPTTLSTQDHVYTLKQGQASNNYTYFRFQVTNGNNANVQIRITFSKPTTSVTVTPDSVTLNPGDTQQLTATVLPVDNTDTLSYSSSDDNVATVSNTGLITAVGVGTANITATSGSCNGVCAVTVELPTIPFITPNKESTSGFTGANETISFLYGNLGSNPLTVVSSDENIVTVETPILSNDSGTVQVNFVGAGSTTVKFKVGATEKASLSVSVTASSVTISGLPASSTAYVGKTLNLGSTITVNAVGVYSDDVSWTSSNNAVAEVSASGVVTGVSTGTVDITVSSDEYPSATMTCEVTVVVDTRWDTEFSTTMVDDIVLPASGDTAEKYYVVAQITAITNTTYGNGNAVDEDGTEFAIWTMYNFNGNLRYDAMPSEQKPIVGDFVVLYGVFTKFNNAPEIKNAWVMQRNGNVFQTPALSGITLNRSSLVLSENKQFTLTAGPNPVDAEMPAVTWESSNDAIASVTNSGVITGESVGSATITATAGGFTATCNVSVSLSVTMEYNAGTTTNMAASGNAATVNLDSSLFTVDAAKGGNNNFPGLNKDNDIRAYDGNDIIVAINSNYTITSIEFDYASGNSYSQVYAGGSLVAGNNNIYTINSESFKIHANGGTVKMNSVEIFYREATAAEKVSRLYTQSLIGYHYSKVYDNPFEYSNVTLRLSGFLSADLWGDLASECDIEGFGIMYAETDNLLDTSIKDWYKFALNEENGNIDNAISSLSSFIGNSYAELTQSKAHPSSATTLQKTDLGVDVGDTYYIWNHKEIVSSDDLDKEFSAIAYIRIDGEIIFLQETTMSVKQAAIDLLASGIYDNDAFDGSLDALSKWVRN